LEDGGRRVLLFVDDVFKRNPAVASLSVSAVLETGRRRREDMIFGLFGWSRSRVVSKSFSHDVVGIRQAPFAELRP
jgi:hypothetical protein